MTSPAGRCTWLVTPGRTPQRFTASRHSGADVSLLDLEDSVPPVEKDAARANVISYLGEDHDAGDRHAAALGLRMNAPGTVHGLKDLVGLAESGLWPVVLLVPKVESSRDVELVAQIMGANRKLCQIWALIETPRAIENLTDILRSPTLAGVLFGAADYAAAAGCRLSGKALWHPRALLAMGAAAAGVPAIDSPYFDLRDPDGLQRESKEARDVGFLGKVAIHPRQLSTIQDMFRPSAKDLAAARAVIGAAEAANGAITTVDGQMVGPPLVATARAITARAGDIPTPIDS
ncbi:aldolase/citrate lyase family protein [Streptomyces sp. NPDC088726]|uniref:aldolase/citrate lyase family protein n=1 Tax=Streptomyces sp. NPDC088726 TaxID=3365874 RepID=UPI00381B0255